MTSERNQGNPPARQADAGKRSNTFLLERPEQVAAALSPLRRQLLEQLVVPGSATEVAARLGLTRQKVNYHIRKLEDEGLVELVEERQRRGCTERVLQTRARRLVVDPEVLMSGDTGGGRTAELTERDRFSVAYQLVATGQAFRDVVTLRQRADAAEQRLALATTEADVAFDSPATLRRFTDELGECIARLAAKHGVPAEASGSRQYRLLVTARPKITKGPPAPKGQSE